MRKGILGAIVGLCLMATTASAQLHDSTNQVVYGGGSFSMNAAGKQTLVLAGGYGFDLGGGLWQMTTAQLGIKQYGVVAVDLIRMFQLSKTKTGTFYAGLTAGPNVDWIGESETGKYITYITGAAGGVLQYRFPSDIGISVAGKYKFALEEDVLYPDGFQLFAGLTKNF